MRIELSILIVYRMYSYLYYYYYSGWLFFFLLLSCQRRARLQPCSQQLFLVTPCLTKQLQQTVLTRHERLGQRISLTASVS